MGVDITMNIIREKETIYENIFDGRNYEWFDNLQHNCGSDKEYDYLPIEYGKPEICPEDWEILDKFCYGFHYITVQKFMIWAEKYKPWLKAGWCPVWEAWLYRTKGIVPEEVCHYKDKDEETSDLTFIEYENSNDCSKWLMNFITEHTDICATDIICYCFDH